MSIKVMSQVWELELPHHQQAILLALADHATDDGRNVRPSIARTAWKTGYSERQVQRIIRSLVETGILEPSGKQTGGRKHPNHYRIRIEKGVKKSPFISGKGDILEIKGDIFDIKGDIAMSPESSLTIIESSVAHRDEKTVAPPVVNSRYPMMEALAAVTGMKLDKLTKGMLGKHAKDFEESGYTAAQVLQAYQGDRSWWAQTDWRGKKGQRPDIASIRQTISQATAPPPKLVIR